MKPGEEPGDAQCAGLHVRCLASGRKKPSPIAIAPRWRAAGDQIGEVVRNMVPLRAA